MSNKNYNNFNTLAQQYGLKHNLKQYLTPSGWSNSLTEKFNVDFKEKMDILRSQDNLIRDIVMGKAGPSNYSFKDIVKEANKSFKEDRYLDVVHWLNQLSNGMKAVIEAGSEVTDLSSEQLGQAYTGYKDFDLDSEVFQDDPSNLVSQAGLFDFLGKMLGGNLEKKYWEKIKKRKIAVQSLLRNADVFVQTLKMSLDRMGNARATGNIQAWLNDFNRIVAEYNKFYNSFKTIYTTNIKELVDLAKKAKEEQEKELNKFKEQKNKVPTEEILVDKYQLPQETSSLVQEVAQEIGVNPEIVEQAVESKQPSDEIFVSEDDIEEDDIEPEITSRPPTEEEIIRSKERAEIPEADDQEQKRIKKLLELITENPSKKEEYFALYDKGDFSFLDEPKEKSIIQKETIKPSPESLVKEIYSPETEETEETEEVLNQEVAVNETDKTQTEDDDEDFDFEMTENSEPVEFEESTYQTSNDEKNITFVIIPKSGIDNSEEESIRISEELGQPILFVKQDNLDAVADRYIKEGYNVSVRNYSEFTNKPIQQQVSIQDLDNPEFVKTLPRLGNGLLWVSTIMEEIFNKLSKKEQDEVRKKLIQMNADSKDNAKDIIAKHIDTLEKMYDKPIDEISKNPFDLLNDAAYVNLLPVLDNGKFNMDLINQFPEAINGGKFFLSSLSSATSKKSLLDQIARLNKKSFKQYQIEQLNNLFFKELQKTSNKNEMIQKLCNYSEFVDMVDPKLSEQLISIAEEISND